MTPPVTIARVCEDIDELLAADECCAIALNRGAQWQQHSEDLQRQIDALKRELDQARIDRDTARALLAGMQGRVS